MKRSIRFLFASAAFAALGVLAFGATPALGASTPTPAAGWVNAEPCARPPRATEVAAWIETPGPVGTPVIASGKPSGGAWSPPTVDLSALPTGPAASAVDEKALQTMLDEISACAAFPGDGVDAYFSDAFFRRTMEIEHSAATPGAGAIVTGYAWGFVGFVGTGEPPQVTKAWQVPGGKLAATIQTGANEPTLVVIFVKDQTSGDWLIDEMGQLASASATPAP